jgi:hypothetical protein
VLGFKLPKFATHYGGVESEYDEQRAESMADEGGAWAAEVEAEEEQEQAEQDLELERQVEEAAKQKPAGKPKAA